MNTPTKQLNTPTPKKSGRKSSSTAADERDLASQVRDKFAKELRPKGRLASLENIILAVQKLVDANRILLHRFKDFIEVDGEKLLPHSIITKRAFSSVESQYVDGCIRFVTHPDCTEAEFDIEPLITVPTELTGIVLLERYTSGLIKYNSLFEKSLLLHDDVLLPFLTRFKIHLGSVQECLLSIDNWLNESETNVRFLQSLFGSGMIRKAERSRTKNPLCANCSGHFIKHQSFSSYGTRIYRCPTSRYSTYLRSGALLLKEVPTSCQVNETYDLSLKDEKDKLLKLVQFVSN
jgi:hypothetical protein